MKKNWREEVLWPAIKNELFLLPKTKKIYNFWTCQKLTEALIYLLDNIYMRVCSKLYRQNIGISMGTNFAPLLLIYFYFAMRRTS